MSTSSMAPATDLARVDFFGRGSRAPSAGPASCDGLSALEPSGFLRILPAAATSALLTAGIGLGGGGEAKKVHANFIVYAQPLK